MMVICAYATTARAPPEVKSKFSSELLDTHVLVMLGDFNARVGVLKPGEEEWGGGSREAWSGGEE